MSLKSLALLLSLIFFSTVMYSVHVLIDNVGADVGTAAKVVYKMEKDPSFIFSITPADIHIDNEDIGPDEILRHDTYIVGPKFVFYLLATLVYWLLDFVFQKADPLSALFLTNMLCLFGSSILIYAIARRSGDLSKKTFYFLLPVLFLSLPATYYLIHDPLYPLVLAFFLLSSIYLVIRAYERDFKNGTFLLLTSGVVLGLSTGVGPQAPLCIFTGFLFTSFVAISKRLLLRSLFLQGIGVLIAVALSELLFQAHGTSFVKWIYLHTHENIYSNYLKEPFPFIPFVYFRIIFALTPATLMVFLGGICFYKLWWRNVSIEGRSLFLSLIIVLAIMSFLPATPLFRIIFPFFVIMQACNFLIVLNLKKKLLRNIIIAVLLGEALMSLPSALFINVKQGDLKSPVMRFNDERLIVKYFNYDN